MLAYNPITFLIDLIMKLHLWFDVCLQIYKIIFTSYIYSDLIEL